MTRQLSEIYAPHLAERPDDICILDEGGDLTFAQFHDQVLRTAAWLTAHDFKRGDVIAIWLVNRPYWLIVLFAAARCGVAIAAVNTRYRSGDVEHVLRKSGARALLFEPGFRKIDFVSVAKDMDLAALPHLEMFAILGDADAANSAALGRPTLAFDPEKYAPEHQAHDVPADTPLILFTTSGTTKAPKLVCHTIGTILYHSQLAPKSLEMLQPETTILGALPLCGVFGLSGVLATMSAGGRIVLMDAFDGPRAAKLMAEKGVTHIYGSDEMYRRIADAAEGDKPFPKARVFGFGAFHPGVEELTTELDRRGFPMCGVYGSSEVQALFAVWPSDMPLEVRMQGGGRPSSGQDAKIRIRDSQTNALLPAEVPGEIEIFTPALFVGYFNDPAETKAALTPDGYFRTGDLGYVTKNGDLVYQARMGDAMRLSGFLVNPVEIDDIIKSIEGVADAQTVGIPFEGRTAPVAFVVPRAGVEVHEEDMRQELRDKIAAFKVPERIWVLKAFPVTQSANGVKIKRAELREIALTLMTQANAAPTAAKGPL